MTMMAHPKRHLGDNNDNNDGQARLAKAKSPSSVLTNPRDLTDLFPLWLLLPPFSNSHSCLTEAALVQVNPFKGAWHGSYFTSEFNMLGIELYGIHRQPLTVRCGSLSVVLLPPLPPPLPPSCVEREWSCSCRPEQQITVVFMDGPESNKLDSRFPFCRR